MVEEAEEHGELLTSCQSDLSLPHNPQIILPFQDPRNCLIEKSNQIIIALWTHF